MAGVAHVVQPHLPAQPQQLDKLRVQRVVAERLDRKVRLQRAGEGELPVVCNSATLVASIAEFEAAFEAAHIADETCNGKATLE